MNTNSVKAFDFAVIKEQGRVVAVESDCLWVETIRQSTCSSCSAQKGCGHGLMNKAAAGKRNRFKVMLTADQHYQSFAVDDDVDIAIPEKSLVQGALIVYLSPLLGLLAGALLVSQWWSGDVAAFIGALVGFGVGVAGVKYHSVMSQNNPSYQPVVIAHHSRNDGVIHLV
jgi:sigma-E factor negative regulatory protein RseC